MCGHTRTRGLNSPCWNTAQFPSLLLLRSKKACPVTSPNGTNLKRRIWWAGEGLSGNIIDTPSRKKFVEE